MTDLVLGKKPERLTVLYVLGDPFSADMTLFSGTEAIAWPEAPVLEFTDLAITWPATLHPNVPDSGPPVADSVARWSLLEEDVAELDAAANQDSTPVRLSIGGVTIWKGVTIRDA